MEVKETSIFLLQYLSSSKKTVAFDEEITDVRDSLKSRTKINNLKLEVKNRLEIKRILAEFAYYRLSQATTPAHS